MTSDEITELFLSHTEEPRRRLAAGGRLVHYTSAEAAYKIIQGRQIWLRNASMMNDFSEIQHGINCLAAAWNSDAGASLKELLKRLKPGLCDELEKLFDGHADAMRLSTFITSLSEHRDEEDQLGRLSMWRAYGGRAGVALVLNNTAFVATTDEMKVFSSPVFYLDVDAFQTWFAEWVDKLIAHEGQLTTLQPEHIQNILFVVFRNFALCTKHPGFSEEREWRVYHSPSFEGQSDWLSSSVEIIGNIPQHVIKLSLHDDKAKAISGVAPASLVNRVIIGPCEHPIHVRASIAGALVEAGVTDPLDRMWMSFIPLRQA